jgi:hypothetical protein
MHTHDLWIARHVQHITSTCAVSAILFTQNGARINLLVT